MPLDGLKGKAGAAIEPMRSGQRAINRVPESGTGCVFISRWMGPKWLKRGLSKGCFMKKLKLSLTMMALSSLVTLVTACANNSSSISTNADSPGAGALGANVDIKDCQVNQAYTTQYGCLNRGQCAYGSGYSAQANTCVPGQLVTEQSKFGTEAGTRHYGMLNVTNAQQFELMLQASGLCNSSYGGGYAVTGMSNTRCAAWITRGSFIVMKSYTGNVDNVNLTIGAGTQFPSDLVTVIPGVYGTQLGTIGGISSMYSSTNYIAFNQQAHNYAFNNGNGMQIVGITQNRPLNFMVMVNNGNLGLDRLEAQIVYQGTEIAKVQLNRF